MPAAIPASPRFSVEMDLDKENMSAPSPMRALMKQGNSPFGTASPMRKPLATLGSDNMLPLISSLLKSPTRSPANRSPMMKNRDLPGSPSPMAVKRESLFLSPTKAAVQESKPEIADEVAEIAVPVPETAEEKTEVVTEEVTKVAAEEKVEEEAEAAKPKADGFTHQPYAPDSTPLSPKAKPFFPKGFHLKSPAPLNFDEEGSEEAPRKALLSPKAKPFYPSSIFASPPSYQARPLIPFGSPMDTPLRGHLVSTPVMTPAHQPGAMERMWIERTTPLKSPPMRVRSEVSVPETSEEWDEQNEDLATPMTLKEFIMSPKRKKELARRAPGLLPELVMSTCEVQTQEEEGPETHEMACGGDAVETHEMACGGEAVETHEMACGVEAVETHDMSCGGDGVETHEMACGDAAPETHEMGCDAAPETHEMACGDAAPETHDMGCGDGAPETHEIACSDAEDTLVATVMACGQSETEGVPAELAELAEETAEEATCEAPEPSITFGTWNPDKVVRKTRKGHKAVLRRSTKSSILGSPRRPEPTIESTFEAPVAASPFSAIPTLAAFTSPFTSPVKTQPQAPVTIPTQPLNVSVNPNSAAPVSVSIPTVGTDGTTNTIKIEIACQPPAVTPKRSRSASRRGSALDELRAMDSFSSIPSSASVTPRRRRREVAPAPAPAASGLFRALMAPLSYLFGTSQPAEPIQSPTRRRQRSRSLQNASFSQ